ncbi:leucine-rich PPR motif-containing protein, mitochondrial-like [Adelges cooleyi]|uniref:leucine-rich PPR motif-containing protein, mitochondrial-like n=1 Tax=Adelges cooleyi TaxID=133065 RepID=UPI0021808452|nr:leucine-rich PPR motif-containing protein, mitochondrial-like [Adelges cooleyi]
MSILIQCSKHIRTAYTLSRHRLNNTLVSSNTNTPQRTSNDNYVASTSRFCTNILPSRSFFSSTILSSSSSNKVDLQIKKLDDNVRKYGRISKQDVESVIKEIEHSNIATPSQALLVIRCCGILVPDELPENRTILAKKTWDTLVKIGVPLDVSHYNTLLKVYLENDHQFSPTEFLEELKNKGITPNRVTYQNLVTSYCKQGDIEGASRILEYMRDKQLPINHMVFNALVIGHSQNGDMESAEGVLNVMKESKLEPSSETYTLLASGYAKKGDIAKVTEILNICEQQDIYLSHKDLLDILYSLATNGHSDKVDEILNRVQKSSGYNQDAINCIYKLTTAGQIETAIKVFDSMKRPTSIDNTTPPPMGRFLINHLIKINCPVNKVIEFCEKLIADGSNLMAIEHATEMALKKGSVNTALGLFEYMNKKELPIRQHYFWPLLVSKSKLNDLDGFNNVLMTMINTYKLTPNVDTLRHYVMPTLINNGQSGSQIIQNLQLSGIAQGTSTHALVLYLLSKNDIRLAADIAATHRAFYIPYVIRQPLVRAFLEGNDIKSLIVILQQICNGFSRLPLVLSPELAKQSNDKFVPSPDTEEQIIEMRVFLGQIVSSIVQNLKQSPAVVSIMQELLEAMYEKGLGISSRAAENVQNNLEGKITFEISNLLENLTDSNLVRKVELGVKPGSYTLANADEHTLENIIKRGEASGETKNGVKRQLFNLYCRNKNLEKAMALKEKLTADGFDIPTGSLVLLLDLYLSNDKLNEAKDLYQQLTMANQQFLLDKHKMVKMAEVIAKNDCVEKAIEFLSSVEQPEGKQEDFLSYQHSNNCWKLLNNAADKGDPELVQQLFDILVNKNYTTVSNIILGPLIKVHLINQNLKEALEKFEWCCKTYRCTPMKNELSMKFIEAEDASSLQTLTDLSTTIHGEINSLYDLMLSFLECGRLKQARKILETPGLKARQDRLNVACAKYGADNSEELLNRLLEVTKDIHQFNRSKIYNELLELHSKNNKVEEAMSLWTQMQEEDIQPSDTFMWSLSELLKKNGCEVPFAVNKPKEKQQSSDNIIQKDLFNLLDSYLDKNDITNAIKIRRKILSKNLPLHNSKESKIIELLTRENKLSEAIEIAKEMLVNDRQISKNVLRFLVSKLSEAGEVASLEFLKEKVPKNLSSYLSLNQHSWKAHQKSGNIKEMFTSFVQNINENLNDKDKLLEIVRSVPGGSVVEILQKDSTVLPTIEEINSKLAPKGITVFANSLWSYFMLNNEFDKADKLIGDLDVSTRIQYRHILVNIRSKGNFELGQKLLSTISKLKGLANKNTNLGLVYCALIDGHVNQDNYVEAHNTLDEALKQVSFEDISESTVSRLKKDIESKGETFKYDIQKFKKRGTASKNRELKSESDSSDSSDDEKSSTKV